MTINWIRLVAAVVFAWLVGTGVAFVFGFLMQPVLPLWVLYIVGGGIGGVVTYFLVQPFAHWFMQPVPAKRTEGAP
jgi:Na+/citrate or Na+/malate symporter